MVTAKINKLSVLVNMLFCGLLIVSCASPVQAPVNSKPQIDQVSQTNTTVAAGIGKSADNIDHAVTDAQSKTPSSIKPVLAPDFTSITTETGNLRTMQGQLDSTLGELKQANDANTQNQKTIADQKTQIDKLTADKKSALQQALMWLILLSVVALGIAGALIYAGNVWGISVGIGAVITLAVSIFIASYTVYLAIGGGILLLGGCGFVIWQIYQRNKQVKAATTVNTALKTTGRELVQTVEAIKMAMSPEARHYMFGNGPVNGHIDILQSPETKQFVRTTRKMEEIKLAPSVPPVELGTMEGLSK